MALTDLERISLIKQIKEIYDIEINLENFKSEVEEKVFRAELDKKDWQWEKVKLFRDLIRKIKLANNNYDFVGYKFSKIDFTWVKFEWEVNFLDAKFSFCKIFTFKA